MNAAIYARVSTDRQGRDQTIDSQLAGPRLGVGAGSSAPPRARSTTRTPAREHRPGLDRLRDAARDGEFDVLAVLSPDRLARSYAYQVLLLEEFRKVGCEVAFVQRPITDDPHDQLLLQIQGAIAEYERALLGERFRRGKLQKARAGRSDLRPRPVRLPIAAPASDGCRGCLMIDSGRACAAPVPVADRRADDRPPDPQEAGRRSVAAALRQEAVVNRGGRPSHPRRLGLRRHGLRESPRDYPRPAPLLRPAIRRLHRPTAAPP